MSPFWCGVPCYCLSGSIFVQDTFLGLVVFFFFVVGCLGAISLLLGIYIYKIVCSCRDFFYKWKSKIKKTERRTSEKHTVSSVVNPSLLLLLLLNSYRRCRFRDLSAALVVRPACSTGHLSYESVVVHVPPALVFEW